MTKAMTVIIFTWKGQYVARLNDDNLGGYTPLSKLKLVSIAPTGVRSVVSFVFV